DYQRIIFLPGPVFGLVTLAGLAGCLIPRRRTADAALLWASAAIMMILPTAEHEYTYRYVLPCIPLLCITAALALRNPSDAALTGRRTARQRPRATCWARPVRACSRSRL